VWLLNVIFDGSRPVTPTLTNLASASKPILPFGKTQQHDAIACRCCDGESSPCRVAASWTTTHRRTHCLTTHTNECCAPPHPLAIVTVAAAGGSRIMHLLTAIGAGVPMGKRAQQGS
jgi:hypothetical protein